MAEPRLFTPYRDPQSSQRLRLTLSPEDSAKIGRGRWGPVEITDMGTGTRLVVQSADCGADCHCAAEVVKVVAPGASEPEIFD